MVSRNAASVVSATALWGLAYIVLFAAYFGLLFYLDEVAQLSQSELNKVAPFAVGALVLGIALISTAYLGIFHARAAEMLDGRPVTFAGCFNPRGACAPACAYLISKSLALGPFFAFGIYSGVKQVEPSLTWAIAAMVVTLWTLIVAYLTMFATAAATSRGVAGGFTASLALTTTRAGETWKTIGVVFLTRLVENVILVLAYLLTAPFLSFAMVAKFRQLTAQNLPGSGTGNRLY
ncbi:hypothetical protein [Corynebacterium sp. H130]|uniref:hypothetical protein n=1 Tax=Corynebacterium sp. H130 TaxID=3133444 RepID=UPI0030AFB9B6